MKKLIALGVAAIAAQLTFAAANDVLITFSTPGPDTYADDSAVNDGEYYALCWSQDFANFAINSDGTVTGGEIVLKAPVVKGGRCPTIVFEVDAAYAAEKNFASGSWSVFLLDTRSFAGSANKVNTVGQVGSALTVGTGSVATLAGSNAQASEIAAGVEVPKPEVTGINVIDGYVYVTVKGTVPYLAYGLTEGATPSAVTEPVGDSQTGGVSADDEVTFVTSAKEGAAFFKVGRKK